MAGANEVPTGGVPREWIARNHPQAADYADKWADAFGVPRQLVYNVLFRENGTGSGTGNETLRITTSGAGATGYMQLTQGARNYYGIGANASAEDNIRAGINYLHDLAWNVGYGATNRIKGERPEADWAAAVGGYIGSPTAYYDFLQSGQSEKFGRTSRAYVFNTTSGVVPFEQLPSTLRNLGVAEFFRTRDVNFPTWDEAGWIAADPNVNPFSFVPGGQDNLNWADREGLGPAFQFDPQQGWFLDPNVLRSTPGALTALQGAHLQNIGMLPTDWGYDYSSQTWQNAGGAGNWQLADTSNPDVIESGLFQQWLPQGYQAAGPEVWEQTPLQFWSPQSTDIFGNESFNQQAGGAGFDLFNPQGQFNVNMLNAPGAVSPQLGALMQSQGQFPHLAYNPVDRVWQDAPPAPGWQLMDINQYSPQALPTLQNYFQSLYPTNDFSDAFEGIGGFSQPYAFMNWVPPAPQGQQYQAGGTGGFGYMGLPPQGTYPTLLPPEGTYGDQPAGATHVIPGIFGSSAVQDYGQPSVTQQIDTTTAWAHTQAQAQVDAFNQQQAAHNAAAIAAAAASNQGGPSPGFGLPTQWYGFEFTPF